MKPNTAKWARTYLGDALENLAIAGKLNHAERERVFTIYVIQYLEALKRSHTFSECVMAQRIENFVMERDYPAATQVWEGRR